MKFNFEKNDNYQTIRTIDAHTEGEPLRIITSGYPDVPGDDILSKRRYLQQNLDHLRQSLMFEPRGHADMYGALITEAVTNDGDFGILFMHNEGYSSMCGHGIIATVSVAMECGDINPAPGETRTVRIDSPAGRITAYARWKDNQPDVCFDCVPSFVESNGNAIDVPGLGRVEYDIAFGGAYYAYVDADALHLDCRPDNVNLLIEAGRAIKQAVMSNHPLQHPEQDDLSFLYGTIFTSAKVTDEHSHSRHVCIFADGEVDRSPTGTGVSGRIALLHHQGQVETGQKIKIESIISSSMTVAAIDTLTYGGRNGVIPRVSGQAFITGRHEFLLDPLDPHQQGFLLR